VCGGCRTLDFYKNLSFDFDDYDDYVVVMKFVVLMLDLCRCCRKIFYSCCAVVGLVTNPLIDH